MWAWGGGGGGGAGVGGGGGVANSADDTLIIFVFLIFPFFLVHANCLRWGKFSRRHTDIFFSVFFFFFYETYFASILAIPLFSRSKFSRFLQKISFGVPSKLPPRGQIQLTTRSYFSAFLFFFFFFFFFFHFCQETGLWHFMQLSKVAISANDVLMIVFWVFFCFFFL